MFRYMNTPAIDPISGDPPHLEDPAGQLSALREHNRLLEARLAMLQQQQEAFAYGISHDLRAPMRVIDSFAVQLQRRCDELAPGEEAGKEHLDRIRGAVGRMSGLIDSLLEYSRVTRADVRSEPVDLSFLADWAMMDLRDAHPGLEIQADVQPGLQARGDERLLKTLFAKWLDNSRKFVDPLRGLKLRFQGKQESEGLHLQLSDEGIGMQLRDPGQPFEPFSRLHASHQGAGDGLGLAIAKAVVDRHHGRIWAESEPGQGATLHVVLPLPQAA